MIQCFVLLRTNPLIALEFLKKNAVKFSAQKRAEIKAKIIEEIGFLWKRVFDTADI